MGSGDLKVIYDGFSLEAFEVVKKDGKKLTVPFGLVSCRTRSRLLQLILCHLCLYGVK